MPTFYLNGDYVPREQALIPVEDRGFIFGDGIYEGVRAVEGRLFEWDLHAERMVRGLAGLKINFGAAEVDALRALTTDARGALAEGFEIQIQRARSVEFTQRADAVSNAHQQCAEVRSIHSLEFSRRKKADPKPRRLARGPRKRKTQDIGACHGFNLERADRVHRR